MSVKLSSKKEQEAIEDALKDPNASAVFFSLAVDDLELGDYIFEGEWGGDESGAISCDLELGARFPTTTYADAPSSFAVHVNGIVVPQMAGLVSLPEINEDRASTNFLAASARAEAALIALNEPTSYPGWSPDAVVKDAVSRLPYSRGHTKIDTLREPLLYYSGDATFAPEEKVADVLSRVEEGTPYKIRDNVWGGCNASVALEPSKVVESFRVYDANDFIKWRPPTRSERRYSEVVVFRRNEDGSDAFEPQHSTIHYRRGKYAPLNGAALWIELDDLTEEAPQKAKNLANQMASRLGRGTFKETEGVILPFFDPLIEIQDVFWVYEDWEDLAGLWARSWMCWVDTYKHDFETLNTEVGFSAALVEEDRIKAPDFAIAGTSGGAVWARLSACDQIGDTLRFDGDELEWVIQQGDTIIFSDGGGNVSQTEDTISIVCPYGPTVEAWGEFPEGNVYFLDMVSWVTSDGTIATIDDTSPDSYLYVNGDVGQLTTGVPVPVTLPLWGEMPPFIGFIEDSVSWASDDGTIGTIDEVASGGNASVVGDVITLS